MLVSEYRYTPRALSDTAARLTHRCLQWFNLCLGPIWRLNKVWQHLGCLGAKLTCASQSNYGEAGCEPQSQSQKHRFHQHHGVDSPDETPPDKLPGTCLANHGRKRHHTSKTKCRWQPSPVRHVPGNLSGCVSSGRTESHQMDERHPHPFLYPCPCTCKVSGPGVCSVCSLCAWWMHRLSICSFWCSRQQLKSGLGNPLALTS